MELKKIASLIDGNHKDFATANPTEDNSELEAEIKELEAKRDELKAQLEELQKAKEEPQAEENMTLDEFITEVFDNTKFEDFKTTDIDDFDIKYSKFLDELTEMSEDEREQLSYREWRELMIDIRDAEVIEEKKEDEEPTNEEEEEEKLKEEYPYLKVGGSASQNIKKELKRAFPNVKFSVRADGNSVRIEWTDGVTDEQVEKITKKYKEGNFNGMIDMYEYKKEGRTFRKLFGGANYIFTYRRYSDKALNWVLNKDNLRQELKDLLNASKVEVVDGSIMVDGDYLNGRLHEIPVSANPYEILGETDLTQVNLDEEQEEKPTNEEPKEEQNPMGKYVETVLTANSLEDFDREDIMEAIEKAEELYNSDKEKYQDEYNQIVGHMNKVALGG
jgi:hypothetical protein